MIHVAIIGAGQLGSRHLQALALLQRDAKVQVVDPSPESRTRAEQRFREAAQGDRVKIELHSELSALSDRLDVAIVATTSDLRRSVVERLLAHRSVAHLVLEKVLFQCLDDYPFVASLLEERQTRGWVNCPRRVWPFYRRLKEALQGRAILEVSGSGSGWGLGCNAIHTIDLISFLSDRTAYTLSTEQLDTQPIASKRAGYIEFTGALRGRFVDGPLFNIASYLQGSVPAVIEIVTEDERWIVRESEQRAWVSSSITDWTWREEAVEVPRQSRLTHLIVEALVEQGTCGLPTYAESAALHLPLVRAFLTHLQRLNAERVLVSCPIT